jgi:S-adenosylhomocysteine hydrolase
VVLYVSRQHISTPILCLEHETAMFQVSEQEGGIRSFAGRGIDLNPYYQNCESLIIIKALHGGVGAIMTDGWPMNELVKGHFQKLLQSLLSSLSPPTSLSRSFAGFVIAS